MDELNREEDFTKKMSGKTLLRIFRLAKPHWMYLVGYLFFIGIISVGEATYSFLLKQAIDFGITEGNYQVFLRYIWYVLLIMLAGAGSIFGFELCAGYLGEHIAYDLRKAMFNRLQILSFTYYDKTPVGWIMSRVTSDSERIAELASWMLLDIVWAFTNVSASIVFMLVINWRMALVVMASLPILVYVSIKFRKFIITEYRKVRSINSRITGAYNENITGVRVVKALVREDQNLRNFGDLTGDMFRASYRAAWLSSLFLPAVQLIAAIAIATVLWYGGFLAKNGSITIGGIQAFIGYITLMMWPIQNLSRVYAEMQRSIASAERVFSLLDTKPEIIDGENVVELNRIDGNIEFEDVSFHYDEESPVLQNFSLRVAPGETIALVGPTGGGKSTIANLVCRFYEPKGGRILINGSDYRQFALKSLQEKLGVVLQTPHLFSGNILENIRYGRLDATDDEVIQAAKLAHAHEFIQTLDAAYQSEVGEGGALLSMGQKQLISLARALLARPEIIIMDEATSSIDTITEGLIQQGINALLSNCTSFVIAHRLSTIRNADRILVIVNGQIIEAGTHDQLIVKGGHYFRLYSRQFKNEKAKNIGMLS